MELTIRIILLALAVALTGCSPMMNLAEVRESPPSRAVTLAGDYRTLARCAMESLQMAARPGAWRTVDPGDLLFQMTERPDQGRAAVTGYLPGAPIPLIDFVFLQVDSRVLVQSRLGRYTATAAEGADDVLGGARGVEQRSWPIIERCAHDS